MNSLYRPKVGSKVPSHTIYIKNEEGDSINSSNSAYRNYTRALSTRPQAKKSKMQTNAVSPVRRINNNTARKKRGSPKSTISAHLYSNQWMGNQKLHQPKIPNPYIVGQRETPGLRNQQPLSSTHNGEFSENTASANIFLDENGTGGSSPDMPVQGAKLEKGMTQQIIKAAKDQFNQEKRGSYGNSSNRPQPSKPGAGNLPILEMGGADSSQRVYNFSQRVFMRSNYLEPIDPKKRKASKEGAAAGGGGGSRNLNLAKRT